jgi:hypothetical protein
MAKAEFIYVELPTVDVGRYVEAGRVVPALRKEYAVELEAAFHRLLKEAAASTPKATVRVAIAVSPIK